MNLSIPPTIHNMESVGVYCIGKVKYSIGNTMMVYVVEMKIYFFHAYIVDEKVFEIEVLL